MSVLHYCQFLLFINTNGLILLEHQSNALFWMHAFFQMLAGGWRLLAGVCWLDDEEKMEGTRAEDWLEFVFLFLNKD